MAIANTLEMDDCCCSGKKGDRLATVESAQQATEIATEFLTRWYTFLRPISAKREDGAWVVQVDVGVLGQKIATLRISAASGAILEFGQPE
jgi:hypothetical protein